MVKRKGKSASASHPKGKDSGSTLLKPRLGFYSLPIEVLDTVFEHSSKSTLLACVRVSRLWRDCSRPHLFASLTIYRDASYDDFFSFLDANTDIARYVRDLTLGRGHGAWERGAHPLVSIKLLIDLMHKLPRLQELRLQDVQFDNRLANSSGVTDAAGRPASQCGEVPPSRLQLLSMVRCWGIGSEMWLPQGVLFDVLSALPADSIHLSSFSVTAQDIARRHLRPLDPRCLVLDNIPSIGSWHNSLEAKRLYEALRHATAPNCLRKLRVCRVDRHDVTCLTALGNFISHAAQDTLQDFELPFSICQPIIEEEDTPEPWNILCLDKCHNLKTFGISFHMRTGLNDMPAYPHVPFSAVAIAILSHLPSTLRHLTIQLLYVESAEQIKNKKVLGLRALDDVLLDRFPALETVRLELRVKYYLLEFTLAAFKTMPKCKKRGILEVADCRDN
ncbi:hypothetical protein GY45DRAFT_1374176 [Cubamyces sp. BRFM 1775]|nr:hypothetical protein GY45DRAFT_1374176 [Cubamyces sp. BRFM 1775]